MTILLELTDAHRSFHSAGRELPVLRGLSLTVEAGHSYAVLGRSGSGKSTLLALLGLLDRPDKGRYVVGGVDTAGMRDHALSRLRGQFFGFIYQRFFLLPGLTALQNVELALVHGSELTRRRRRQTALAALERVGLADRAHHRPAQLSGGEQQRTAIARAVAQTPRVILADEPTGALDERTAEDTVGWLLQLCEQQDTALVIVTHDPQVAARATVTHRLSEGRWV